MKNQSFMKTSTVKGKILITGATGLIGSELSLALLRAGWKLVILGRSSEEEFRKEFTLPCDYHPWPDPTHSEPPEAALAVDCAVNLMGEPIVNRRWTDEQKTRLRDSRLLSTQNLVCALKKFNPGLKTFVSSSAIGYYGDAQDEKLTEKSPASDDFLGLLCKDWETAAKEAPGRCVLIRTGVVLSSQGGALAKMLPLFERGLAGKLSRGTQWMSWIHIQDLVSIYLKAIDDTSLQGAFNAVAPAPVTNDEFTRSLAKNLKVRAFLPVPKVALVLAMGEMSQILLSSQRVLPEALESRGVQFRFPKIDDALSDLFAWKESKHDRLFESTQWVAQSRKSVFPFFSETKNLEILTPEFLNFRVLNQSTEQVQSGTEINYQLKIHGVPVKWRSKVCDWNPEVQFRDVQLKGPYSKWDHTHIFEDLAGGTLLIDRVIYRMPLACLGGNLVSSMVKKDIQKIFSFRKQKIRTEFGNSASK